MVQGRRSVGIHERDSWVFNRMVAVYDARPPYPPELVEALLAIASGAAGPVLDVGAGVGHLALPLAAGGLDVVAVEPAIVMLEQLRTRARERALTVQTVHGAAEELPLDSSSIGLAVLSDVVHFLDAERSGRELSRILGPRGGLALVTCEFGDTPFMRGIARVMESAAPRRPRDMSQAMVQLFALCRIRPQAPRLFHDETPLDEETLDRLLGSISFIGPAMNEARRAAFRERVLALPEPRVWARKFTLRAGMRRRS